VPGSEPEDVSPLCSGLFDRWVELDSSTPPGPRLMQMPRLLCMLRDHLRGTLSAASTPWSVPALLVALRQDDLNNKTCCTCSAAPSVGRVLSQMFQGVLSAESVRVAREHTL